MNTILKVLFYLAVVIVLVLIGTWNDDQQVDVTYFPGRTIEGAPVFLVILGSAFVGVLFAGAIAAVEHFKHGFRERELQRKIQALESEVRGLRNLPIAGGLMDSHDESAGWEKE